MNKTIILLNTLAVILVAGASWFLHSELSAGREAKLKLAGLKAQASDLSGNKQLLDQLDGADSQIEGYFINSQTLPSLIELFENTANTSGVVLDLTQAEVEGEDAVAKLRLELTATGSFAQVTNYLARLEAMPYELLFNNVRLDQMSNGEKSTAWRLQVSTQLVSYHNEKI